MAAKDPRACLLKPRGSFYNCIHASGGKRIAAPAKVVREMLVSKLGRLPALVAKRRPRLPLPGSRTMSMLRGRAARSWPRTASDPPNRRRH